MAILATQTVVGNVGKVYERRTVGADNKSVIDFSVAVTPRKRSASGEWTDGETYWVTVTAWGKLAENVEGSFRSGDRVFVHGRTDMKPAYQKQNGGETVPARPVLIADFAGLEVSSHPATSNRQSSNGGQARSSAPASAPAAAAPAPAAAPAAASTPAETDIFSDDPFDDDPPF